MPIIKQKILLSNNSTGATITFGLNGNNILSGYQQEIENLTEETKADLINPVVDNEVRRFQYNGDLINILFYFTPDGISYENSFVEDGARFLQSEVNSRNEKLYNSFFIMDFYDTYNNNTQTNIFTIYQTQILDGNDNGSVPIPSYRLHEDTINQLYSWYVPESFITEQTGSTVTAYVKFSFYNAKYGDITLFFNKDNQDLTTPEKMYFKSKLNLDNMTWSFDYVGTNFPPNVVAYQVALSNTYSQKVNNAVNNFDNKQQIYPSGNTFQTDGTYIVNS